MSRLLRLKANPSHPTYQKVALLIEFLEKANLELEWVEGALKVRDTKYCVAFDLVRQDEQCDGEPISDLPPTFEYKLTREKMPNKYCRCRHCDPKYTGVQDES